MRKAARILAAALVAATASVMVAGSAQAAATTTGEYVALGDSYASGVGAYPYDPASGDCQQSPDSYPRTWAKNHAGWTLRDMTCSGATIADVRSKQMGALSAETKLVSITVGGNDVGFRNIVTACLTGTDDDCQFATNLGAYYSRTQLVDDLAALYTDVKAKAPNARVFVMAYPRLVDAGTGSCGVITPSATRRSQLNFTADNVAAGISEATQRGGVKFVEMRLPFEGHEACSADPWINGVDAAHINEIFHPTKYGHSVVYTFMLQAETDLH
ncbi:SGNH/GDSL hydrolase family protein [Actinoplanes sp. NPDC049265]|uniref:SGNH/GDSL hydrolase family protein n=1 Tax=Actinoplanes sp. NPDC049265 TaxID=3363902 RepID=UPI003723A144